MVKKAMRIVGPESLNSPEGEPSQAEMIRRNRLALDEGYIKAGGSLELYSTFQEVFGQLAIYLAQNGVDLLDASDADETQELAN